KTTHAHTSAEVLARSKSHSSGTRPVARTLPLRHCAAVRKTHQRHALSRQTDALSWLSPGPFCIIPPGGTSLDRFAARVGGRPWLQQLRDARRRRGERPRCVH